MNAIVSSNTNKTAVPAHPEVAKTKVDTLKTKVTAPVQAAEVLNKTPANKSNSSPAAVVSLGSSKATDSNLYQKSGQLEQATSSKSSSAKISAKSETPGDSSASAGTFVAGKGDVVVDIKNSDSGYDNKIYWSTDNFKTKHYIGVDNNTGSVNIGKFAEGTKIDFGIDNGVGQFFKTGAASTNSDNLQHAKATKTDEGTQIGFEDLQGGGDNDFNDAIINVRNLPAEPEVKLPPEKVNPEKVTPKVETKDPKVQLPPADTKTKVEVKPNLEVKDPKPENKIEPKVDTKKDDLDAKVLPKNEPKNEPKDEIKTEPKDTKPEPKVEPKVEPKDNKTVPKVEVKDTKTDPKVVTKVEVKDTKPDSKPETKIESKVDTKTTKTEEKVVPKVDAKVDPKITKPDPKVETKTDSKTSTNRSGLGDGTNPGQGDGKVNATNTGTNNPGSKVSAYTAKPPVGAQLKIAV